MWHTVRYAGESEGFHPLVLWLSLTAAHADSNSDEQHAEVSGAEMEEFRLNSVNITAHMILVFGFRTGQVIN